MYNLEFSEILEYVRNHKQETLGNANILYIYMYLFDDSASKSCLYKWNQYNKRLYRNWKFYNSKWF